MNNAGLTLFFLNFIVRALAGKESNHLKGLLGLQAALYLWAVYKEFINQENYNDTITLGMEENIEGSNCYL